MFGVQRLEGGAGGDLQRRSVLFDRLDGCIYVMHFFFKKNDVGGIYS